MANEVICGNQKLDCAAVVDWVRNHPDCTKDALMSNQVFRDLVHMYSEQIKAQHDLAWANYEWFADVVLGQLISADKISVKFGVWGMKGWR